MSNPEENDEQDDSPIAELYDNDELADVTFFNKPVLELDRDELLSLIVLHRRDIDRLEGREMSSEQYAKNKLFGE